MKRLALCCLIAGMFTFTVAQTSPVTAEPEASISGRVLDSVTGDPVGKVTLMLASPGGAAPLTAETPDDGRFVFENLSPGRYGLIAQRAGYARQAYGGRGSLLASAPLRVTDGESLTGVEFRIVPQSVIAGRVLDEDGDPLTAVLVTALQPVYRRGKRMYAPTGTAQANDLGEFRISGLGPGRYYLSARYRNVAAIVSAPGSSAPEGETELVYNMGYYPRSTDLAGALPIELPPGTELPATDIWMSKVESVRVSGKVTGLAANTTAMATLSPKGEGLLGIASGNLTAVRPPGGEFEFRGVTPGSYVLSVTARLDMGSGGAMMPVEVSDHHISGLELNLGDGVELSGIVRIEDGQNSAGAANVQVLLEPIELAGLSVPPRTATGEDGQFTIESVPRDTYELHLSGNPPASYIKSIRLGSRDVTESGIDLTAGPVDTVDVTLSPSGARVDGVVMDSAGEPMSGAIVALIPASGLFALYKSSATDQNGHFDFQGVTPGDYKLLAWDQIEQGAFMDPEFVRPFAGKAESLSLEESDRRTVSLEAIRVKQ